MSLFVQSAFLASVLPSFAVALGSVPVCKSGFDWTFNSLDQSPCTVASALAQACNGLDFQILPVNPTGNYPGPAPNGTTQCRCNSVFYSMLSACALCQDAQITAWSFYTRNCGTVFVEIFPLPIPVGFAVPAYAYLDVTRANSFSPQLADTGPESTVPPSPGPSTIFNFPPSSIPAASPQDPASGKEKKNTLVIPASVLGGLLHLLLP